MKRVAWFTGTMLLLATPVLAVAADGYVTGNVNLRAGPDTDYPLIDTIPIGAPVSIQGCTDGWAWCDVIFQDERGWVAGNYIQYDYDDQQVLLPQYGAQIGIPIVTFAIGAYWDRYYVSRPFYRERDRWYRRPPPRRPPPPPIHRPWPHPGHAGPAHPPGHRPTPSRPPHAQPRPPGNHPPSHMPGNRPATRPAPPPHGQATPRPPQHRPPAQSRPAHAVARPVPAQHAQPARGKNDHGGNGH